MDQPAVGGVVGTVRHRFWQLDVCTARQTGVLPTEYRLCGGFAGDFVGFELPAFVVAEYSLYSQNLRFADLDFVGGGGVSHGYL